MTAKRAVAAVAMSGLLSLAGGTALYAADASLSDTGPDSHNTIDVDQSNNLDIDNHNDVTVNNTNDQTASTGDAEATHNTTAGDATSGSASNTNSTTTTVSISNDNNCDCLGGTSNDPGNKVGAAGGGGSVALAGAPAGGGVGGGSLSAVPMGVGGGSLPVTGPHGIVDVSALRNALHPNTDTAAANKAKGLSTGLLALASGLCVAGAASTAVFSKKKALKS